MEEKNNMSEDSVSKKEWLHEEYLSAIKAYQEKNYKVAFEKANDLLDKGLSEAAYLLGKAYYYGHGTNVDYNKAIYYISYQHPRTEKVDKQERDLLEKLLEMRDKTGYSACLGIASAILLFFWMIVTGFFLKHTMLAVITTLFLTAVSAGFYLTYRKRYIFDFSYCFFVFGCMFLSILIL